MWAVTRGNNLIMYNNYVANQHTSQGRIQKFTLGRSKPTQKYDVLFFSPQRIRRGSSFENWETKISQAVQDLPNYCGNLWIFKG